MLKETKYSSFVLFEHNITGHLFHVSGDIGGLLGLTVGASILTVAEFLDLLFVVCAVCYAKGRHVAEAKPAVQNSTNKENQENPFNQTQYTQNDIH